MAEVYGCAGACESQLTNVTGVRLAEVRHLVAMILIVYSWSFGVIATSGQIDECHAVLSEGIRDRFETESSFDFRKQVARFLSMSREEQRRHVRGASANLSLPIPIAEGVLDLDAGASNDSDRFRAIRGRLSRGEVGSIDRDEYRWFVSKVASQVQLDAWLRCIELVIENAPPRGLQIEVRGDVASQFSLVVSWHRTVTTEQPPVVERAPLLTNLRLVGDPRIVAGRAYLPAQEIVQTLERIDPSRAAQVVIFHSNANDVQLWWDARLPHGREDQIESANNPSTAARFTGRWSFTQAPPSIFVCATHAHPSMVSAMAMPRGPAIRGCFGGSELESWIIDFREDGVVIMQVKPSHGRMSETALYWRYTSSRVLELRDEGDWVDGLITLDEDNVLRFFVDGFPLQFEKR